ncbi:MAG TPA: M23 family metallopeptidase [Vicinamibacterales bacterium]|jgi:murein DD-endopeptidase MepM/ murein hydrolase activator NlpD|nr:M23 family metallopeptidase [Vicinamibacterales bacterium]
MLRWLAALLVLLVLAAGIAYVVAGRGAPPRVTINQPTRFVGRTGSLDVTAEAPNAKFTALDIALEQNGRRVPLFALGSAQQATVAHVDPNQLRVSRPIGKQSIPELQSGNARIVVTATRPSFLNLRQLTSTASKDIQVRLEPPRIAVVSTKHYVNLGGSEMVVYRATPPDDVTSGVRVGDVEYPGFPAAGAGVTGTDRGAGAPGVSNDLRVAFFALLHDQDLRTPIVAFARDEAGNEAKTTFVDNVFPKPFKKSRIELDDKFIDRVVPEIIEHSPEMKMTAPAQGSPEMLAAFVKVNSELRKINANQIAAFAAKTSPTRLWSGPFVQLGNSQVEASFADHRTYFYKGKEVDQQTHLGFDLAVTSRVPVVAANAGTVMNANWLGIYGNCVILDHGMGVQSLYGHLSSFDVKTGDTVTRGQTIGRSGMTGLAGGDHLHFTMLVGGRMVNPVEWWDAHWIADRVERKLNESR